MFEKRAVRIRMVARGTGSRLATLGGGSHTSTGARGAHHPEPTARGPRESGRSPSFCAASAAAARARKWPARALASPLLHDTISLTMLQGGYKINVIPASRR